MSINQHTVWPTRQALEAVCGHAPDKQWVAKRYGRLVPTGRIPHQADHRGMVIGGYAYGYETSDLTELKEPAPIVQLPPGYGYELETLPNEVPADHCRCGIYALKDR